MAREDYTPGPNHMKAIVDHLDSVAEDREPRIVSGDRKAKAPDQVPPGFLPLSGVTLNLANVLDVRAHQPTKAPLAVVVRYCLWNPKDERPVQETFSTPSDVRALRAAFCLRIPEPAEDF